MSAFSPTHQGREHVVSFLDSFSHQGPEASHVCIVFEPLGENLLALIERHKKKGVPRALVKVIAKQILLGLEYLHDECDLVHTDIKPENICECFLTLLFTYLLAIIFFSRPWSNSLRVHKVTRRDYHALTVILISPLHMKADLHLVISIPDIEEHIHNELSQSPSPTSRRVGVPLPVKTRAGVSIPLNQQRTRRQVTIFDSQPLASPGRSAGRSAHGHSSLSMNARPDNGGSQNGSYVAQMHMSRTGSGYVAHSSGTVASLSSSAPKVPSGLSSSAPRNDLAFQQKTAQMFAAKGISAVPPRVINSPSTSSSSSSISSVLASTAAGSSSIVSTPPTSLSHSLGNAVMEFMGTGNFETELRTHPKISPPSKSSEDDERGGLLMPSKQAKKDIDLERELSSAISTSWRATENLSKDKTSTSFASYKSTSSPNKASKQRNSGRGHTRSHSGLSNAGFWKDPGTAAPAPAILVNAVVGAGGREDDFSKLSTIGSSNSTSENSSASATLVRPSPTSTPLPIAKKSPSLMNGVSKLIHNTSFSGESPPPNDSTTRNDTRDTPSNVSNSQNLHLSLLTQTAPSRASPTSSPSKRAVVRVSPPQQVSQLSAHMHLHKPPILCNCSDASHHHSHSRSKIKSRSSRLVEHAPISFGGAIPSTSVTPTPTSPTPTVPPPTPIDPPSIPSLIPPPLPNSNPSTSEGHSVYPRTLPQLRTPADDRPLPPPISVKIADLGNATPSKKHYTEDIQTRQYRSPEAILGRRDWDAKVDIWSVACVVSKAVFSSWNIF